MTAMSAHTPMDRAKLARLAYTAAWNRLLASRRSGKLSTAEALAKLAALRAAYDKRREAIRFGSFVRSHRLEAVFGMEG